jgi:retinol dehydrogenase-12
VRQLARDVRASCPRLDVLVNNAGGMFGERLITADGFERTWAVNHLAGLLLTLELLPLLKASRPARVVNVSSMVHSRGALVRGSADEHRFSGIRAYGRSKLAQIACGYVLARRLAGSGVTVNALHPGVVATDVGREMGPLFHFFQGTLMRPFAVSAEQAARTSVFLASSPEVEGVTGGYFVKCRQVKSSRDSYSESEQARVWDLSLSQLGLANLSI